MAIGVGFLKNDFERSSIQTFKSIRNVNMSVSTYLDVDILAVGNLGVD
jgi:hypothetical protein